MDINPYHNVLEDVQALAGLLTGGTPGLTFLAYYASGVPFGVLYFLINIPFYIFAFLALGRAFAFKTFCAVALLSLYSEWLPHWIRVESIDPVFAAILGGLLAGAGLLMLIRHQASLGGIGVLAIYLQQRHGWRAGSLQMIADDSGGVGPQHGSGRQSSTRAVFRAVTLCAWSLVHSAKRCRQFGGERRVAEPSPIQCGRPRKPPGIV